MTRPRSDQDTRYLSLLLKKIRVCKLYKPKFGQGAEVSLARFQTLYGSDPLYSWFGLDNPLMYAAHKAAGGMTSLYRQIGNGLEMVFRQLLRDQLGLTVEQSSWSYTVPVLGKNKPKRLTLDGRIVLEEVRDPKARQRVAVWMASATKRLGTDAGIAKSLKGIVFEVRQGYKSKDSKRQNADIANAGTAYSQGYLPVAMILSTQIDKDVAERYMAERWVLLRGYESSDPLDSTYAFCSQVLGYDLKALLKNNATSLKQAVNEVLETLLTPSDKPAEPVPGEEAEALDVDELELMEGGGETDPEQTG